MIPVAARLSSLAIYGKEKAMAAAGSFRMKWVFPKNRGIPKSLILIGFSIINHPFSGTPIFGNTQMLVEMDEMVKKPMVS